MSTNDILEDNRKLLTNNAIGQANITDLNLKVEKQRKQLARNEQSNIKLTARVLELQGLIDNMQQQLPPVLVVAAPQPPPELINNLINIEAPLLHPVVLTIGEKLINLVNDVNKFQSREIVKGRDVLSISTGFLLNNLVSVCLCSVKKLPMIITTILTMFFGKLSDDIKNKLIKTKTTYLYAMEKSNLLLKKHTSNLFNTINNNNDCDGIFAACLLLDASTKRGQALNTKPITYLNSEMNAIKKLQLSTDNQNSKKAELSSNNTQVSMGKELSLIGISKIDSGGSDKFGQKEVSKVLKGCDVIANNLYNANIGHETFIHIGQNGVVYNSGVGKFRMERVWTCLMHAIENILKPFLFTLIQVRGLDKDAYIASNMFKLSYYMRKFDPIIKAINVCSVGGIDYYDLIHPLANKIFTEIQNTRFTNQARQCTKLIELLSLPASDLLIEKNRLDYIDNIEEWNRIKEICVSFHSVNGTLSHIMLQFLYISNHSPGGIQAEGFTNCMDLVAFLGSPVTRINLVIVSQLYELQMEIAEFADQQGRIRGIKAETITTRLIDSPVFLRKILSYLYKLQLNWRDAMPVAYTFMVLEANRAVVLGVVATVDEFTETMENRMNGGLIKMWEKAEKYFVKPYMTRSFSVLLTLIPRCAALWARAILFALQHESNEYIEPLSQEEINSFVPIPDIDLPDDYVWHSACDLCPFPNMTYQEFYSQILNSFIVQPLQGRQQNSAIRRDKIDNIEGILHAYGFIDNTMVAELKIMATGYFMDQYNTIDSWRIDSPVE